MEVGKRENLIIVSVLLNHILCLYSSNITCLKGLPDHVSMQHDALQKINEAVWNNSMLMSIQSKMDKSLLCTAAKNLASKILPRNFRRIRSFNSYHNSSGIRSTVKPVMLVFSTPKPPGNISTSSTIFNHSSSSANLNSTRIPPRRGGGSVYRRPKIKEYIIPKPKRTITVTLSPALLFAYTLQLIAEKALQERQGACVAREGKYDYDIGVCKLKTSHNTTMFITHNNALTNPEVTYIIIVVGNGLSLLCLIMLLLVYTFIRSLQTRSDKNIMCLAVTMAIAQTLQLVGVHITKMRTACTMVAVALHWMYLTSFMLMTVISYDFLLTFGFLFKNMIMSKKRLVLTYIAVALGIPTTVVLVCILVHIINKTAIGYGVNVCFIGNVWANLYAYILLIVVVMIINSLCLLITIVKLRGSQQAIKGVQSRHKAWTRHRLQLTVMTLKVSTLTSIGWIFGLFGGLLGDSALTYMFVVLTACQGIFIFTAFCCNYRVYTLAFAYIQRKCTLLSSEKKGDTILSLQNRYRDADQLCISSLPGSWRSTTIE